jgi:hypothetical protein
MELAFEIVKVISATSLIDPESYQCTYQTVDAHPLERAHYVVLWPSGIKAPKYDRNAKYFGPFKSELHARLVFQLCLESYVADPRVPLAIHLRRLCRKLLKRVKRRSWGLGSNGTDNRFRSHYPLNPVLSQTWSARPEPMQGESRLGSPGCH